MKWVVPTDRPFDLQTGQDFHGGMRYMGHADGLLVVRYESSLGDWFTEQIVIDRITMVRWRTLPEEQALGISIQTIEVEVPA